MRKSGILLPIFSLPSKYGIGCFSKEAYEFIDKLKLAGQSIWQILPLGPTGYGDSPYQSFSTFAGNPYFIDLEDLIEKGLLTENDCNIDWGDDNYIDYGKIYNKRYMLLRKAYERSNLFIDEEFEKFCNDNSWWLDDYALYISLKDYFNGKPWYEWDEDIKTRYKVAVKKYNFILRHDIMFHKFIQFTFASQWKKLKEYANKNGIMIIGDIPIYVALDSADTWSNPELFKLNEKHEPIAVSGCPPDEFSKSGQLWGNPIYDWDYHKASDYEWWIKRVKYALNLYDIIRLDHFRGFDEYYSIPYGSDNAINGSWEKGPGIDLFNHIQNTLGDVNMIAEDLGFLTDSVKQLLKDTGYPGMKILEFAFDGDKNNCYLPQNYINNCVVYTGTHDNETIIGWWNNISETTKGECGKYLNEFVKSINWKLIHLAMGSIANLCIVPLQDYLGLGNEARINAPSSIGINWRWRMQKNCFDKELCEKIKSMNSIYNRNL